MCAGNEAVYSREAGTFHHLCVLVLWMHGSDTACGAPAKCDDGVKRLLGMDLVRLVLERAATAKEVALAPSSSSSLALSCPSSLSACLPLPLSSLSPRQASNCARCSDLRFVVGPVSGCGDRRQSDGGPRTGSIPPTVFLQVLFDHGSIGNNDATLTFCLSVHLSFFVRLLSSREGRARTEEAGAMRTLSSLRTPTKPGQPRPDPHPLFDDALLPSLGSFRGFELLCSLRVCRSLHLILSSLTVVSDARCCAGC